MIIGIEAAHANKPNRTGVEEYCWQTIQELKFTIPATERVILYTNKPLLGDLGRLPPNWKVKILGWPFRKLWSQVRLSFEFLFHPPDVFFAPGQLLPWLSPKKCVVTVHDSAFINFPSAFNFFGRQYLKLMQFWIVTHAEKIITPSEFSKNELKKTYHWLRDEKISVIPLGFDKKIYHKEVPRDLELLERFGIFKPYIISVGRLEEKKNTKRLVEAFNLMRGKHDIQLILVGKPRVGYETVKNVIDSSPYTEDIIQLGHISNEEVAKLVKLAEVFVFPSLHEGFGIPVLEAMAVGCPVVLSTAGALPETGGQAALYTSPTLTDAIAKTTEQFLENAELRIEYTEKGYEQAAKFSWERSAALAWKAIVNVL